MTESQLVISVSEVYDVKKCIAFIMPMGHPHILKIYEQGIVIQIDGEEIEPESFAVMIKEKWEALRIPGPTIVFEVYIRAQSQVLLVEAIVMSSKSIASPKILSQTHILPTFTVKPGELKDLLEK